MRPPRIAVTGVVRHWKGADRTGVNAAYVQSLIAVGAVPLIVPPMLDADDAAHALDGVDGVLFSGGEDIDPRRYGAAPAPALGDVDPARDALELALFATAYARGLPILGICRGLQLANVALGGTLWQDLPSERPSDVAHNPSTARGVRTHAVTADGGSLVAQALGTAALDVNSFHHQAVRDLAGPLVATAWAPDGVVEAVQLRDEDGWLLAVQWHPEEMVMDTHAPDRGLFRALVEQARSAYCR